MGDPPREILKLADDESCDLIAMTTHGHRLIGDIMYGSTIEYVRHRCKAPLLIVTAAHAQTVRPALRARECRQCRQ